MRARALPDDPCVTAMCKAVQSIQVKVSHVSSKGETKMKTVHVTSAIVAGILGIVGLVSRSRRL